MLQKYTGGKLPGFGEAGSIDEHLSKAICDITSTLNERYDNYDFARILEETFKFINTVNKYINDSAPWKIDKSLPEGKRNLYKILRSAVISIYCISYLIYPFMPDTAARINKILNVEAFAFFKSSIVPENIFDSSGVLFKDWHKINESREILFPKIINT